MDESSVQDPVFRYLRSQIWLGAAVGVGFGTAVIASDTGGIRTLLSAAQPVDIVICFASGVLTIFPVVMATLVGMLAWDQDD